MMNQFFNQETDFVARSSILKFRAHFHHNLVDKHATAVTFNAFITFPFDRLCSYIFFHPKY